MLIDNLAMKSAPGTADAIPTFDTAAMERLTPAQHERAVLRLIATDDPEAVHL